jgi:predicted NAD/FAD-dependent oxidoreductase
MAVFDRPVDVPFDGLFFNAGRLSWAARNASKPGRAGQEIWMLHTAGKRSLVEAMAEREAVEKEMVADFFRHLNLPPAVPRHVQSRLWRAAAADKALDQGCLWDETNRIGVCGDWCAGSRIEGAFLSGSAVAGRLLAAAPRMALCETAAQ